MKIGLKIAILLALSTVYAVAAMESYRGGISDYGINILGNFNGTTCDQTGTSDSHACIQAAIDYCVSQGNNCRSTFCPDGVYRSSLPIFVDPPGNLRGADGTNGMTYNSGATYSKGQTVNYGGVPYISLVNNNTGNTPPSSPTQWQPFLYSFGTIYGQNAIVSFNGVPWISLQSNNRGNTPSTSSAYWALTTTMPTTFSFSLSFFGNSGLGNAQTSGGCEIRPTFANGCALWLGTGQGMSLKYVSIRQNSVAGYRGALPSAGTGVCESGGAGGSSRNLIEDVGVYNEFTCFKTGANSDGLDDSTTWLKTDCSNAYRCIWVTATQNDINHAIDTTCSTTIAYQATSGPGIVIDGGNPSAASSQSNAFSISSTGALSAALCPGTNGYCYTFQTTLASPDQYVCTLVYNAYTIVTTHFGVIPLIPTSSCDRSSGVITFEINPSWGLFFFQWSNATSSSALQTDIRAANTIYAAEHVTTYYGMGIKARGQHIENNNCTTLIEAGQTFNGDHFEELDGLRFNVDPGLSMWRPGQSPTNAQLAQYYCQQAFGFIIADSGADNLSIHDSWFGQSYTSEPVVIDWGTNNAGAVLSVYNNNHSLFAPNVRTTGLYQSIEIGGALYPTYATTYCAACGAGNWDVSPFLPHNEGLNSLVDWYYRSQGPLSSPFVGFYPAPWSHPRLTPTDITALTRSLGAIGSYPIINGSTIYSVVNYSGGLSTGCIGGTGSSTNCLFAQSNQLGFSWGQDLTTSLISGLSWSAQGGSFAVYLDTSTMGYMQAGLEIGLTTSAAAPYIVTGVYPGLGYITVQQATTNNFANGITGTSGTVYTGKTITQQAYAITRYP